MPFNPLQTSWLFIGPAGLVFERPELIRSVSAPVVPALQTGYLPLGNVTTMSIEQRSPVCRGFKSANLRGLLFARKAEGRQTQPQQSQ